MPREHHRRRSSRDSSARRNRRRSREFYYTNPTAPSASRAADPVYTTNPGLSRRGSRSSLSSSSSSSYMEIRNSPPRRGNAFTTFFTAPSARRRRSRRRARAAGILPFGNSSSSSLDSDLAYGTGYIRRPRSSTFHNQHQQHYRDEHRTPSQYQWDGSQLPQHDPRYAQSAAPQGYSQPQYYSQQSDSRYQPSHDSAYQQHYSQPPTEPQQPREPRAHTGSSTATPTASFADPAIGAGLGLAAASALASGDSRQDRDRHRREDRGRRRPRDDREDQNMSSTADSNATPRPARIQRRSTDEEIMHIGRELTRLHSDIESHPTGLKAGSSKKDRDRGIVSSRPYDGAYSSDDEGGEWESVSSESQSGQEEDFLAYGSTVSFPQVPSRPADTPSAVEALPPGRSAVVDPRYFGPQNSLNGFVSPLPSTRPPPRPMQRVQAVPMDDERDSIPPTDHVYPKLSRPTDVHLEQPKPVAPVSPERLERSSYSEKRDRKASGGKDWKSPSGGKILTGAALATAAGVVGNTILSNNKAEESTHARSEELARDEGRDRSKQDRRLAEKRELERQKQDEEERKRKLIDAEYEEYLESMRRRRSGDRSRRTKHDDAGRQDIRKEEPKESKVSRDQPKLPSSQQKSTDDYYDHRRVSNEPRTGSKAPIDPFQFQVADNAFPTPTYSRHATPDRGREVVRDAPQVYTIDREPSFSPPRLSRKDSFELEQMAEDARNSPLDRFEEEEAALKRAYEEAKRRANAGGSSDIIPASKPDEDSAPRGRQTRDPVLERADKFYRESEAARRHASEDMRSRSTSPDHSVVGKWEEREEEHKPEIIIVTPPGAEHHKQRSPYDQPNADVRVDAVFDHPREFTQYLRLRARSFSDGQPLLGTRDPSAERERPLLNLVRPTPVPSPSPERRREKEKGKGARSRSRSRSRTRTRERGEDETEPAPASDVSSANVVIGPRGEVVALAEEQSTKRKEDVPAPSADRSLEEYETPNKQARTVWGVVNTALAGKFASSVSDKDPATGGRADEEDTRPIGAPDIDIVDKEPVPKMREFDGVRSESMSSQRDIPGDREVDLPPLPDSQSGTTPSSPKQREMPGSFGEDFEFAATVGAGLKAAGFDDNIAVDDPQYRRRDSPPGSNDELSSVSRDVPAAVEPPPEEDEWGTSLRGKKKKKKAKKGKQETLAEPELDSTPAPEERSADPIEVVESAESAQPFGSSEPTRDAPIEPAETITPHEEDSWGTSKKLSKKDREHSAKKEASTSFQDDLIVPAPEDEAARKEDVEQPFVTPEQSSRDLSASVGEIPRDLSTDEPREPLTLPDDDLSLKKLSKKERKALAKKKAAETQLQEEETTSAASRGGPVVQDSLDKDRDPVQESSRELPVEEPSEAPILPESMDDVLSTGDVRPPEEDVSTAKLSKKERKRLAKQQAVEEQPQDDQPAPTVLDDEVPAKDVTKDSPIPVGEASRALPVEEPRDPVTAPQERSLTEDDTSRKEDTPPPEEDSSLKKLTKKERKALAKKKAAEAQLQEDEATSAAAKNGLVGTGVMSKAAEKGSRDLATEEPGDPSTAPEEAISSSQEGFRELVTEKTDDQTVAPTEDAFAHDGDASPPKKLTKKEQRKLAKKHKAAQLYGEPISEPPKEDSPGTTEADKTAAKPEDAWDIGESPPAEPITSPTADDDVWHEAVEEVSPAENETRGDAPDIPPEGDVAKEPPPVKEEESIAVPSKKKKKKKKGSGALETTGDIPVEETSKDQLPTDSQPAEEQANHDQPEEQPMEPEPAQPVQEEDAWATPTKGKKGKKNRRKLDSWADPEPPDAGAEHANGHANGHDQTKSGDIGQDPFLASAGTSGEGVGLPGATATAVVAASAAVAGTHATDSPSDTTEKPRDGDRAVDSGSAEIPGLGEGSQVVDPDIVPRQVKYVIDPQHGDLLTLPPSRPTSPGEPVDVAGEDLPRLPDSRPDTPPEEAYKRELLKSRRRKSTQESSHARSTSETSIPLPLLLGQRSNPSSPRLVKPSPTSSPSSSTADMKKSFSRPISWDGKKDIRPLILPTRQGNESPSRSVSPLKDYQQRELGPSPAIGLGLSEAKEHIDPASDIPETEESAVCETGEGVASAEESSQAIELSTPTKKKDKGKATTDGLTGLDLDESTPAPDDSQKQDHGPTWEGAFEVPKIDNDESFEDTTPASTDPVELAEPVSKKDKRKKKKQSLDIALESAEKPSEPISEVPLAAAESEKPIDTPPPPGTGAVEAESSGNDKRPLESEPPAVQNEPAMTKAEKKKAKAKKKKGALAGDEPQPAVEPEKSTKEPPVDVPAEQSVEQATEPPAGLSVEPSPQPSSGSEEQRSVEPAAELEPAESEEAKKDKAQSTQADDVVSGTIAERLSGVQAVEKGAIETSPELPVEPSTAEPVSESVPEPTAAEHVAEAGGDVAISEKSEPAVSEPFMTKAEKKKAKKKKKAAQSSWDDVTTAEPEKAAEDKAIEQPIEAPSEPELPAEEKPTEEPSAVTPAGPADQKPGEGQVSEAPPEPSCDIDSASAPNAPGSEELERSITEPLPDEAAPTMKGKKKKKKKKASQSLSAEEPAAGADSSNQPTDEKQTETPAEAATDVWPGPVVSEPFRSEEALPAPEQTAVESKDQAQTTEEHQPSEEPQLAEGPQPAEELQPEKISIQDQSPEPTDAKLSEPAADVSTRETPFGDDTAQPLSGKKSKKKKKKRGSIWDEPDAQTPAVFEEEGSGSIQSSEAPKESAAEDLALADSKKGEDKEPGAPIGEEAAPVLTEHDTDPQDTATENAAPEELQPGSDKKDVDEKRSDAAEELEKTAGSMPEALSGPSPAPTSADDEVNQQLGKKKKKKKGKKGAEAAIEESSASQTSSPSAEAAGTEPVGDDTREMNDQTEVTVPETHEIPDATAGKDDQPAVTVPEQPVTDDGTLGKDVQTEASRDDPSATHVGKKAKKGRKNRRSVDESSTQEESSTADEPIESRTIEDSSKETTTESALDTPEQVAEPPSGVTEASVPGSSEDVKPGDAPTDPSTASAEESRDTPDLSARDTTTGAKESSSTVLESALSGKKSKKKKKKSVSFADLPPEPTADSTVSPMPEQEDDLAEVSLETRAEEDREPDRSQNDAWSDPWTSSAPGPSEPSSEASPGPDAPVEESAAPSSSKSKKKKKKGKAVDDLAFNSDADVSAPPTPVEDAAPWGTTEAENKAKEEPESDTTGASYTPALVEEPATFTPPEEGSESRDASVPTDLGESHAAVPEVSTSAEVEGEPTHEEAKSIGDEPSRGGVTESSAESQDPAPAPREREPEPTKELPSTVDAEPADDGSSTSSTKKDKKKKKKKKGTSIPEPEPVSEPTEATESEPVPVEPAVPESTEPSEPIAQEAANPDTPQQDTPETDVVDEQAPTPSSKKDKKKKKKGMATPEPEPEPLSGSTSTEPALDDSLPPSTAEKDKPGVEPGAVTESASVDAPPTDPLPSATDDLSLAAPVPEPEPSPETTPIAPETAEASPATTEEFEAADEWSASTSTKKDKKKKRKKGKAVDEPSAPGTDSAPELTQPGNSPSAPDTSMEDPAGPSSDERGLTADPAEPASGETKDLSGTSEADIQDELTSAMPAEHPPKTEEMSGPEISGVKASQDTSGSERADAEVAPQSETQSEPLPEDDWWSATSSSKKAKKKGKKEDHAVAEPEASAELTPTPGHEQLPVAEPANVDQPQAADSLPIAEPAAQTGETVEVEQPSELTPPASLPSEAASNESPRIPDEDSSAAPLSKKDKKKKKKKGKAAAEPEPEPEPVEQAQDPTTPAQADEAAPETESSGQAPTQQTPIATDESALAPEDPSPLTGANEPALAPENPSTPAAEAAKSQEAEDSSVSSTPMSKKEKKKKKKAKVALQLESPTEAEPEPASATPPTTEGEAVPENTPAPLIPGSLEIPDSQDSLQPQDGGTLPDIDQSKIPPAVESPAEAEEATSKTTEPTTPSHTPAPEPAPIMEEPALSTETPTSESAPLETAPGSEDVSTPRDSTEEPTVPGDDWSQASLTKKDKKKKKKAKAEAAQAAGPEAPQPASTEDTQNTTSLDEPSEPIATKEPDVEEPSPAGDTKSEAGTTAKEPVLESEPTETTTVEERAPPPAKGKKGKKQKKKTKALEESAQAVADVSKAESTPALQESAEPPAPIDAGSVQEPLKSAEAVEPAPESAGPAEPAESPELPDEAKAVEETAAVAESVPEAVESELSAAQENAKEEEPGPAESIVPPEPEGGQDQSTVVSEPQPQDSASVSKQGDGEWDLPAKKKGKKKKGKEIESLDPPEPVIEEKESEQRVAGEASTQPEKLPQEDNRGLATEGEVAESRDIAMDVEKPAEPAPQIDDAIVNPAPEAQPSTPLAENLPEDSPNDPSPAEEVAATSKKDKKKKKKGKKVAALAEPEAEKAGKESHALDKIEGEDLSVPTKDEPVAQPVDVIKDLSEAKLAEPGTEMSPDIQEPPVDKQQAGSEIPPSTDTQEAAQDEWALTSKKSKKGKKKRGKPTSEATTPVLSRPMSPVLDEPTAPSDKPTEGAVLTESSGEIQPETLSQTAIDTAGEAARFLQEPPANTSATEDYKMGDIDPAHEKKDMAQGPVPVPAETAPKTEDTLETPGEADQKTLETPNDEPPAALEDGVDAKEGNKGDESTPPIEDEVTEPSTDLAPQDAQKPDASSERTQMGTELVKPGGEAEPLGDEWPASKSKKKKGKKAKKGSSATTTPAVSRPESPAAERRSTTVEEAAEQAPAASGSVTVSPGAEERDMPISESVPQTVQADSAATGELVEQQPEADEWSSVGKKKKGKKGHKKGAASYEITTPAVSRPLSPVAAEAEPSAEGLKEPESSMQSVPAEAETIDAGATTPVRDDLPVSVPTEGEDKGHDDTLLQDTSQPLPPARQEPPQDIADDTGIWGPSTTTKKKKKGKKGKERADIVPEGAGLGLFRPASPARDDTLQSLRTGQQGKTGDGTGELLADSGSRADAPATREFSAAASDRGAGGAEGQDAAQGEAAAIAQPLPAADEEASADLHTTDKAEPVPITGQAEPAEGKHVHDVPGATVDSSAPGDENVHIPEESIDPNTAISNKPDLSVSDEPGVEPPVAEEERHESNTSITVEPSIEPGAQPKVQPDLSSEPQVKPSTQPEISSEEVSQEAEPGVEPSTREAIVEQPEATLSHPATEPASQPEGENASLAAESNSSGRPPEPEAEPIIGHETHVPTEDAPDDGYDVPKKKGKKGKKKGKSASTTPVASRPLTPVDEDPLPPSSEPRDVSAASDTPAADTDAHAAKAEPSAPEQIPDEWAITPKKKKDKKGKKREKTTPAVSWPTSPIQDESSQDPKAEPDETATVQIGDSELLVAAPVEGETGDWDPVSKEKGKKSKKQDQSISLPTSAPRPASPVIDEPSKDQETTAEQSGAVATDVERTPTTPKEEEVEGGGFTTSKKDKKRGRESSDATAPGASRAISPTRAATETEASLPAPVEAQFAEDEWALPSGKKKGKKKGKKAKTEHDAVDEPLDRALFLPEGRSRETTGEPPNELAPRSNTPEPARESLSQSPHKAQGSPSRVQESQLTPAQASSYITHDAPSGEVVRPEKKLKTEDVNSLMLSDPVMPVDEQVKETSTIGQPAGSFETARDTGTVKDVPDEPEEQQQMKTLDKGMGVDMASTRDIGDPPLESKLSEDRTKTVVGAAATAAGAANLADNFAGQISKSKKKGKKKKALEKRTEQDEDLFDDPLLWESPAKKTLVEEEEDAGGEDAFWDDGDGEGVGKRGLDLPEPMAEVEESRGVVGDKPVEPTEGEREMEDVTPPAMANETPMDVATSDPEKSRARGGLDETGLVAVEERASAEMEPSVEKWRTDRGETQNFESGEAKSSQVKDRRSFRGRKELRTEAEEQGTSLVPSERALPVAEVAEPPERMEGTRGLIGLGNTWEGADESPIPGRGEKREGRSMADETGPIPPVTPTRGLTTVDDTSRETTTRSTFEESPFTPLRRSISRNLEPVPEEEPETFGPPGQAKERRSRRLPAATPDINRDSGFVTDSPRHSQRSQWQQEGAHRDSGVHLKDWTESPRQVSPEPSSSRPKDTFMTPEARERRLKRSPRSAKDLREHEHHRLGTPVLRGASPQAPTPEPQKSLRGYKTPDAPRSRDQDLGPPSLSAKRPVTQKLAQATPSTRSGADSPAHGQRSVSDNVSRPRQTPSPDVAPRRVASNTSLTRHRTPDPKLRPDTPGSIRSLHSATPPLRRAGRRISGDLRSISLSQRGPAEAPPSADSSDEQRSAQNTTPVANEGRVRAKDMTDVYDGFGEGRIGSPRSPTRPHSMRRRQSMQVIELESQVNELLIQNQMLQQERQQYNDHQSHAKKAQSLLADRDAEIDALKRSIEQLNREVSRLVEVNDGLNAANAQLSNEQNSRYRDLELLHAEASRELETMRGSQDTYNQQLQDKDAEIADLRDQLETAKAKIQEMQEKILETSRPADADFLDLRDVDYFDHRCQQLCQHVQQWVLRFSKFSDMRSCRLTSEINDEKIIDRLDNTILDGSDVDAYLRDRVRRRDIFMSMTMNMIWEFVFTRYLFGMDREQRQKLKSLEKHLTEVGPPNAVRQWRAVTLTLLSRRSSFKRQRELDCEAVVQAVLDTLSLILPPPTHLEDQIQSTLRRVMAEAVDLAVMMRTQRAEYMMLPPLEPKYDADGELAETVTFNASLMNERSGDRSQTNEELQTQAATVRVVLFPLVVRKGDENGVGDDEVVVCPAQVLIARSRRKSRGVTPSDLGGAPIGGSAHTLPHSEYMGTEL